MKILFIVQGEGRGHLTQAISMAQILRKEGHELVGVLVGKSEHRSLPEFFQQRMRVTVETFDSPNFLPTSHGHSAGLLKSISYNILHFPRFWKSISFIRSYIRNSQADLVINFYELLTGITYALYKPSVPMICVAHQYIFLHPDYKFPPENPISLFLLRLFTRITAIGSERKLALSIRPMKDVAREDLRVVPPLLRDEVFRTEVSDGDYLHGYLLNSGFRAELEQWHQQARNERLEVFWDRPALRVDKTLRYHALDEQKFLDYLGGCKGYLTTAGFESVCEAVCLGKPIFMVPTHIEQRCNAYDAALHGIGYSADEFNLDGFDTYITRYTPLNSYREWIFQGNAYIASELQFLLQSLYSQDDQPFYAAHLM